ncbi:Putative tRNA-m1A22 methylase [Pseudomonas chlororaphis subsp. aureofaciens]|nr:Putative tRNA-m1A22 methylase [Pseudomonas chlororaphis subsp. aureofaciens]AZE24119.1 Putative tRNA-m1A22 methylase [Pseudomonas chlororaphis subsp. aureofaciens]
MICDILDSGKARLVRLPNGGEQWLHQWLMENGYRVLCEEVLRKTASATKSTSPTRRADDLQHRGAVQRS